MATDIHLRVTGNDGGPCALTVNESHTDLLEEWTRDPARPMGLTLTDGSAVWVPREAIAYWAPAPEVRRTRTAGF